MADLKKLFVTVPSDKIEGFLSKYVTGHTTQATGEVLVSGEGEDALYRSKDYDAKIVFLGNSGQIFTQGQLYGAAAADVTELKAVLAGFDSDGSDDDKKTVAAAIEAAKKAVLGTTTGIDTTADEYKTGTVAGLNTRIATIEALIDADGDEDTTINKLQEIIAWFAGQAEGGTAADLISNVNANTEAIGKKAVAESVITAGAYEALSETEKAKYTAGTGDNDGSYVKAAEAATGLYKEVEDAKAANTTAIETAIEGLKVNETTVKNAESNEVVSFKYSETDGVVSISDLTVVTKELGTVGLTKATEGENAGKWVAGSASDDKGLATAADVAAEIVADEEVIATALNDHETRISANTTAIGTANTAAEGQTSNATGLYKKIEEAQAAVTHAKTTVADGSAAGYLKVDGTDVQITQFDAAGAAKAVQGETTSTVKDAMDAIGTASVAAAEGVEAKAATGLTARVEAIEAWDMWETYTPAQA